jgi:sugar phosphate isomerase/epimerase
MRLAALAAEAGRPVRVAFEPEPGCVVETTEQAAVHLAGVDPEHLGVCLDLAHLACAWESPDAALDRLARAGLPIVKVQVSAALEVIDPAGAADVLAGYAEPRYLHQTRGVGGTTSFDDLPEALDAARAGEAEGPWRIHFHVPLHAAPEPPLSSTTLVVRAALAALASGPNAYCDHLEVETYTWGVLPPDRRPNGPAALVAGIAGELAYTRDLLRELHLEPWKAP